MKGILVKRASAVCVHTVAAQPTAACRYAYSKRYRIK